MDKLNHISNVLQQNPEHLHIYFLGIGGIGMSALARYFNQKGCKVSGYDKTSTWLTSQLISEGIDIHFEDDIQLIPSTISFVIYTPAIPKDLKEYIYLQDRNELIIKRSDALQLITQTTYNFCVAGTHGKTTTSSMIAHILRHSETGCNAFLGGISTNYNSNFWSDSNNIAVIEADEYDRSFLKLAPNVAVITAMDADHLDIYGTKESIEDAFIQFSHKLKQGGLLLSKFGLSKSALLNNSNHYTYHLSDARADYYVSHMQVINGTYHFNVIAHTENVGQFELNMGGLHNIENMLAAIAVCHKYGVTLPKIADAVKTYKGVKRRFEYLIKSDAQVLIDDYAHHPDELNALIASVKHLYPNWPVTLVFQPHLYSRTNDFATEFAHVLSQVNQLILLPIYPARELPIEGVTSSIILDKITHSHAQILSKQAVIDWVVEQHPKLLVMAGAGDIDVLAQQVKQIIENNHHA